MNLDELQVEIRARSSGAAAAMAARMVQHRPGPLLAAWAVYSAGVIGLGALLLWGLDLHAAWVLVLTLLLAPLFSLPLISSVGHLVFSPSVSFGAVARVTARRLLRFVTLFIVVRVTTLLALLALIVPGLYAWRSGWFLGPIVVLEGAPLGASFRRGRRFAAGFHGRTAGHAANAALLLLYLSLAFGSLVYFMAVQVFGLTFTSLANLPRVDGFFPFLVLVGFGLAAPFVTLMWFFVYLDVRIRKEGWDLELAFRSRAAQMERTRGAA